MQSINHYNILNWYDFKKNSSILEIVYEESFLKNKTKEVNIKKLDSIKEKYDYIVMVDVFQHASLYTKEDPYNCVLKKVKSLLKNKGHLLLAVNNRFGLKYFAGFPEDNTNKSFDGILGYKDTKEVKTFTKKEICELIKIFKNNKFYYPYPNYKNTLEIMNDNSINRINPTSINNPLDQNIVTVFNEREVNKQFITNGIADIFADCFLIDLSDDKVEYEADYLKISSNRNDKFSICTELNLKANKVIKKPLTKESISHLQAMSNKKWKSGIISTLKYSWQDNKLICKMMKNRNLSSYLDEYLLNDDLDSFWNLLKKFKDNIYISDYSSYISNDRFIEVFGDKTVEKDLRWSSCGNIDISPNNIFIVDENKWIAIDHEWTFEFPISAEYMLWSSLNYYYTNSICSNKIEYGELLKFIEIDDNILEIFNEWQHHFIYDYVGTTDILYKVNEILDLQQIEELKKEVYAAEFIMDSTSWKITKPLRMIMDLIRGNKHE